MRVQFENLFRSISNVEADVSLLDMHSLTDMVDHIRVIIKTLQVYEVDAARLKATASRLDDADPEITANVREIEDKLADLTSRSAKALKIVEVSRVYITSWKL